jgi:putative transposase
MPFMSQTITRQPYCTDLTDAQWALLQPLLTLPDVGASKTTDLREVINAYQYRLKTGCQWDMLPHDFPPEGTVRRYLRYFKDTRQFETINNTLRQSVRVQEGRHKEPTLAIIDSQSVKGTRSSGECGFDAGKKNQWNQATLYG